MKIVTSWFDSKFLNPASFNKCPIPYLVQMKVFRLGTLIMAIYYNLIKKMATNKKPAH